MEMCVYVCVYPLSEDVCVVKLKGNDNLFLWIIIGILFLYLVQLLLINM